MTVWYQVEINSENRWVALFGKFPTLGEARKNCPAGGRVVKVTQTFEVVTSHEGATFTGCAL